MKKYLFMAAVAGLTLTSCSQEEIEVPVGENNVIALSTPVVAKNTRAANEVGVNYNTGLNFKVWAQHHAEGTVETSYTFSTDQYINGVQAFYDDVAGTWYPKDASGNFYYWPKKGSLTFIACSPWTNDAVQNATIDATGLTIPEIEVSTDPAEQTDILYSERTYYADKAEADAATGVYPGMGMTFKHALSSIYFNVKLAGVPSGETAYPGTTVRLKGIRFENVHMKGTFKQNLAAGKTNIDIDAVTVAEVAYTKDATMNEKYPVTLGGTMNAGGIVLDSEGYYPCTGSAEAPFDPAAPDAASTQKKTRALVVDECRKTDLILLPQLLKGASVAEDVKLIVDYSIQQGSGTQVDQEYVLNLGTDAAAAWKSGYRYLYNISITLNPITLAPEVDVWVDADSNPSI